MAPRPAFSTLGEPGSRWETSLGSEHRAQLPHWDSGSGHVGGRRLALPSSQVRPQGWCGHSHGSRAGMNEFPRV